MELPETRSQGPPLGTLGRYQLLEQLGQGGMGLVYLAEDTELGRRVAVKLLPPESVHDAGAVARFRREAKALAQLAHPGIVQAYDAGSDGDRHFLVMEYVAGTNLGRLLQEKGRLSPGVAADYIHQAALALQHAHDKGLVHRDLKPSNLLLTPDKRVKVLDLGLARFLQDQIADPGRTREGTGLGTPDYTAPEQWHDAHRADARADIYSLGCTLYHLIAGRVPFPGSSLSEKCQAHESQEPTPLGEICPEVPTGLALVVRRMMAKRPAERFPSAQEVADALAPYVADASLSAVHLRNTLSWHGSQLTLTGASLPVRRRLLPWAIASLAVAALAAVLAVAWPRLFVSPVPNAAPADTDSRVSDRGPRRQAPPPANVPPADPNVLTVSRDTRDGGQFRTLTAALEKARPGMTIRVLDDATYAEPLRLQQESLYAGLTLEAPRQATIAVGPHAQPGIAIVNVPGVTLRGFRIRSDSQAVIAIAVGGHCPGLMLEDLDIEPGRASGASAISLEGIQIADGERPLVVQHCHIHGGAAISIRVIGWHDYWTASLCRRVLVRDNRLETGSFGVLAGGALQHIQIVGNQIDGSRLGGIQLENLLPGTDDVLVANNTIFECTSGFRIWDAAVNGKRVEVRNNLILASQRPDMVFIDSGGDPDKPHAPGDGNKVLQAWQVDHNWREGDAPRPSDLLTKSWIPPGPKDTRTGHIDVRSRRPDSPDFLRPAGDSPLATVGAGEEDPSLPRYVGAVPPKGVAPWEWDRTRRMPRPAPLLTVSRNATDGGRYRTLAAALAAAKPWATIRVLDDAVYAERLALDDAARYEGIALEAPRGAVLRLKGGIAPLLEIRDVPHVWVKGFRLDFVGPTLPVTKTFVRVSGHCPGVILEDLDARAPTMTRAFVLDNVRAEEDPVVIKRCRFRPADAQTQYEAILVSGPVRQVGAHPTGPVCVRDNRVTGALRGVVLSGALAQVQVTANILWDCAHVALQVEDLVPGSHGILLANNTVFDCGCGFRVWEKAAFTSLRPGQVEVRGNLFFHATEADIGAVQEVKGGEPVGGDGGEVIKRWRFGDNRRDLSGSNVEMAVPLAPGDRQAEGITLLSRDPADPDFARPPANASWATLPADGREGLLPAYVGAVPPKGTPRWDWKRTWRWRARSVSDGRISSRH